MHPRIYKSGDFLCLVFEPLPGNVRSHSVSIPITEKGFKVLIKILSDRERSPFVDRAKIASVEAPIQYMVDEYLRKGGEISKLTKKDADENITLEDLGL